MVAERDQQRAFVGAVEDELRLREPQGAGEAAEAVGAELPRDDGFGLARGDIDDRGRVCRAASQGDAPPGGSPRASNFRWRPG